MAWKKWTGNGKCNCMANPDNWTYYSGNITDTKTPTFFDTVDDGAKLLYRSIGRPLLFGLLLVVVAPLWVLGKLAQWTIERRQVDESQ